MFDNFFFFFVIFINQFFANKLITSGIYIETQYFCEKDDIRIIKKKTDNMLYNFPGKSLYCLWK